jgi:hypothetical protein
VWDVGALAPGQEETLALRVRTTSGGALRNCADVTAHTGADRDSAPGNFDPDTDEDDEDDEVCLDTGASSVDAEVSDDTPRAGSDVEVTVTARNADGDPIPDIDLSLEVDGANGPGFGSPRSTPNAYAPASAYAPAKSSPGAGRYVATETTGADGSATFTITGYNPGIDSVTAFVDVDGDGILDPDEVTSSFTLTWIGDGSATRLSGDDRVQTAVAISKATFPVAGSAGAVVLTRSDEFADGLAGTPFARSVDAPLLVTATGGLHPAALSELRRVLASGGTVYLLGGTAAVSDVVAAQVLAAGYEVVRIGGLDRYETAVLIAERLGDVDAVFISRSLVFADALAAGPAAIAANGAIVLSAEDRPHATTDAYLADHPGAEVFAVGGPAASAYPAATAIVGDAREDTAVMVAERFFPDAPVVGFARKDEFVDALTGGVHIGRLGGPVVLTASTELHPAPAGYLDRHRDTLTQAFVYGGPVAVSEEVRGAIGARLP